MKIKADLRQGDCLAIMAAMPDNSVDLILTDPPYFKVKDEPWDHQWNKPQHFLAWLGQVLAEFQRILKPNGSLYLFAGPKMATRVEMLVADRFNVLNNIRWYKAEGWHKKTKKEELRQYLQPWESVIFAEHIGADDMPKGTEGYSYKRGQLYSQVMQPLIDYLKSELQRKGLEVKDIDKLSGTRMGGHWFKNTTQWTLPTKEKYDLLRHLFGPGFLLREWDDLAAERDRLAVAFAEEVKPLELWRHPFSVHAEVMHTDLWTYSPVRPYPGKHVCEKPAAMLEDIINASSRPGDVVFDAFAGGGSTGCAAVKLGRHFIGCEMAEHHHQQASQKIETARLAALGIHLLADMPAPANQAKGAA